jgi:predicted dehydrogenase
LIRLGLVGGGPGSFIGGVHRMAAELDRRMILVAGAFSSDPDTSRRAGTLYGIEPDRAYPSVDAMIAGERGRPDGIEAIAIATPNHLHLPAARAGLEAGLAVISDKPPAGTLAETRIIADIVARTRGLYALTFTYTGYPMLREARARIAAGEIGAVRKVIVEYLQGWLSAPVEQAGNKQATWRVDPRRSGLGGCITDIGTHAFNLAEFATGLRVTAMLGDLGTMVPGRALDDDATILLRFDNAARGHIAVSQIASGARNDLTLRVYGERGSLRWSHEAADRLTLSGLDGVDRILWQGSAGLAPATAAATRLPTGHPEGFIEAFSTIYGDFTDAMRGPRSDLMQTIEQGIRAMAFVETAVERNGQGWSPLLPTAPAINENAA